MSSSTLTVAEQKQLIYAFITINHQYLTSNKSKMYMYDLDELSSNLDNTATFVDIVNDIRFNDLCVFEGSVASNGSNRFSVWLPDELAYVRTDDIEHRVDDFLYNYPDFKYNSSDSIPLNWYVLTELRFHTLCRLIANLINKQQQLADKQKKVTCKHVSSAKTKASAKTKTKTKTKSTKVIALPFGKIKKNVYFVDMDHEKSIKHLWNNLGSNVDLLKDYESELAACCHIDHIINATECAKREADVFIEALKQAKAAGAEFIVDSDWCEPENFEFDIGLQVAKN